MGARGALKGARGAAGSATTAPPAARKKQVCPHCGAVLQAFELPEAGGWGQRFHLACFNNDCPYYRRGWDWMMSQYSVKVSYRYRLDPASGCASPIAVWSETALVDRILKKDRKPAKKQKKGGRTVQRKRGAR
jgi:hypothetical protein